MAQSTAAFSVDTPSSVHPPSYLLKLDALYTHPSRSDLLEVITRFKVGLEAADDVGKRFGENQSKQWHLLHNYVVRSIIIRQDHSRIPALRLW